jgi:hypothetical protein
MRTINIKVVLTNDNQIASIENSIGLPNDQIETHLILIGVYENLKQKHLDKLNTKFEKTIRKEDGFDL